MGQNRKILFHVDVNSAFLSWEAVHRLKQGSPLDLRSIPAVVGGNEDSRKGIVLARSQPAKSYGIYTGETLYQARKKCPQLVVTSPNHQVYAQYSAELFQLLQQYSPSIAKFSIDEGFLDFTGMENLFGKPIQAAYLIKDRIHAELGFTVNIGISCNKLLAKMAGELSKPNKVHTLWPEEIMSKLWPLPIQELYMVGRASVPILNSLGIRTIGDLAQTEQPKLERVLKSHGRLLWNYANGIEEPDVLTRENTVKGIGNSCTTPEDVQDQDTAYNYLLSLAESVAFRLREDNSLCNTVAVGLKDYQFKTYSHQRKLGYPTDLTQEIYDTVKILFREMWKGEPLRLLEVRVTDLSPNSSSQLTLFTPPKQEKLKNLDTVIDKIRTKNGKKAILRASLLQKDL